MKSIQVLWLFVNIMWVPVTLQASDFLSTRQNRKIINFGHAPDEYRKKKSHKAAVYFQFLENWECFMTMYWLC